ncbi:cbb3-type cytochrome c oxidase subunit I [Acidomonas methanolica]|uniref:Cytochrome c oxidase subunit 1 n=1 Tax=Acidomonas methanolica NBRC 104435 TaxID=1231351 RepID=A0A023D341_ACIMT|nr:cbb3-type cytochrome c oxidase subunit I [Acidomonas methanolica]MBU2654470.1 cbb3-type cytochrome c oxidase subunit I [Acidomonas methanolica]TCS28273.1 cytochrome c oxidase subunit 1 [Acidomonas methanolica]GAJ28593.1 cytochrome c oxidase subunit 1 [Acidomonas methanolica NBRC 104435]GBQ49093.1 cytochrome c oxidase subunit I [Acidomonas methanolica]GEK98990.1 cytochrome c oxidase subunit 1 [Acidomonas methanolica NBRC 104435]
MSAHLSTPAAVAVPRPDVLAAERRMMLAFLVVGFSALLLGAGIGPLQALNYSGHNLYPALRPFFQSYYQGLTIHGVMNGYVFTFFVICGLLVYLPARELGITPNMTLWRGSFVIMLIGTGLVLAAMFDNSSNVLWTFYPPLKGSPLFYFGLTALGLGSTLPLPILLQMRSAWKKQRPGEVTPLVTYMALITMLMWDVSTIGIMTELVIQMDPWSLGLIHTVDPAISRTLYWLTGHPIVYFWLMPAYVSWYGLLANQLGGRLASDAMGRLTFVLMLIFSLPVGSHHQFADPGFSPIWRGILVVLTMSVAFPSLITAFTMGLTLEFAGRKRGGKGILGWFKALPWGNPSVAAQVLSMLTFVIGGASGMVNGSWQLDAVVHNTTFIPGHFHMTVGSVVAMTFMGMAFWLIPHLTGRALISRRLALAAAWLWFIGMSTFGIGMQTAGLYGVPRRAWVSALPHEAFHTLYGAAHIPMALIGIGGVILWLAMICFYIVFFGSLLFGRKIEAPAIPFARAFGRSESYSLERPAVPSEHTSSLARAMEPVWFWTGVATLICALSYVPIFWSFLRHMTLSPGWVAW